MNNVVVYTAIFGDRDLLRAPIGFPGVRYVCFTDNETLISDVWEMVYVRPDGSHPRRQAKRYKVCPHLYFPDQEFSVWVDATHVPLMSPADMVKAFLKESGMALFAHNKRSCAYDEARECVRLNLDDRQVIERQVSKYRRNGYPEKNGLATCTVIMRRHHDPQVIRAMDMWWDEIRGNSVRDQISFNYVVHSLGVPYATIEGDVYDSPLFRRYHHIGTPEFYAEEQMGGSGVSFGTRRRCPRVAVTLDRCIGLIGIYVRAVSPRAHALIRRVVFKK